MYTMGREREKELLRGNSYYRAGLAPHFELIDIYHDWANGDFDAAEALRRVLLVIDATPTTSVLDSACYWFRRAVKDDAAFEAFPLLLAEHKSASVRSVAPGQMREPNSERELAAVAQLFEDRSSRVRRATVNVAESRRWLAVTPLLERYAQGVGDAEERARVVRVKDFIVRGYRVEEDRVVYYSGREPGGAGAISNSPSKYVAEVPFERISRDEGEYRRMHGVWPTRPDGYDLRRDLLAAWRPLAS